MHLKKFVSGLRHKFFGKSEVLEQKIVCGIELQTIKGTVRDKVDQDDAWFFYLAKNNVVIFDIGANVGYTALLALIQDPDKRYILVDPNPLALKNAGKNLALNALGANASYFPAFVSDTQGNKVKFYTIGTGAAGSMFKSHAKTASLMNSYTEVQTVTLDYLSNYYKLEPDLVKIDVEGAEALVLAGATEMALNSQTQFFVEMHALEELTMKENADKVMNWCEKVNYTPWYMTEGKQLIQADMIAHRGKCHLLLLPNDVEYPDYLVKIKQNSSLPDKL